MAFSAPFSSVFRPPFGGGAGKTRYTLTLQPDAATGIDNWVTITDPNSNYSNDTSLRLLSTARRGLLKFNLSPIPAGAAIVSATINLYAQTIIGASTTVSLNRILAANSSWTHLGSCWNTQNGVNAWAGGATGCGTSGTDYSSTLMGSFAVTLSDSVGKEYTAALDTTEFGLMITTNNGITIRQVSATQNFLCTSNHATAGYRPKLVVVYDA